MKNIRILHLYSNALDLYGDYKNLTVLCQRIAETGNTAEVTEVNLGEVIDPTGYDFVYIGHGKARNLAAVAPHFVRYGEAVRSAIEGGQVWLVTGNARELFGKSFTTPAGETLPGLGLFDSASATERTRDFCGLFPLHIAKYAANRCIYSTNLIIPFCAHPFDHIFAHRQRKPPRRGFPSGGVDCFLLCRPSAPSLSCLEVGHRALL